MSGKGSGAFLERLCANRVARDVGQVTYTQMLNPRGGIECDFTVTRLADERFRIVTGTAFGQHDLAWMRQHAPDDGSVEVADVTSQYACYGVWGPRARAILQPLTTADLSNEAFPYMRARELAIGRVPCLALRVTYVGELGWELYCRSEFGLALWDTIWEAGREHGLVAGGYKAIDSLRLEKGYRVWGADITPDDTPFEAGLGFAVKLDKGDFVGREALVDAGAPARTLRCLTLDDARAVALGSEPVRVGADLVGRVTSGGYGYTVEKSIAYAYLPTEYGVGTDVGRRDLRRLGAGRRRRRAAVRSARRADPGMSTFAAEVERVWPGRDARFEVLGGGITNHNLKVEVDGERVRPPRRGQGHEPARDRPQRRARGDRGGRCARHRPGGRRVRRARGLARHALHRRRDPRAVERMREPEMLARVADALRAFHDGPAIPGTFDSFRVVEIYRQTALDRGGDVPDAYEWAHEIAREDRGAPRERRTGARATTTS